MFLDDVRPWRCQNVVNTRGFSFTSTKIAQQQQQQQPQQEEEEEEHMTPCKLGAGGPCRGAAWILAFPVLKT